MVPLADLSKLPMLTDKTFLEVHPDTLAWWKTRGNCKKCAHCVTPDTLKLVGKILDWRSGMMKCGLFKSRKVYEEEFDPRNYLDCIDASADDRLCGPSLKRFIPISVG